ncbi:MAG TPA: ferritin-like domain-containing protein [bacterium]|nr:ferritin-like domain-containing protein [bacterium]
MSNLEPVADKKILDCLNKIFRKEMAGIHRYLHYSFMIMGHNRIPIQKWFRDKANENMLHAVVIGEKITALGGHPSLESAAVPETKSHLIDDILKESYDFEKDALQDYVELVKLSADDIALDEMAREFVRQETEHLEEVAKMIRKNK